ncbi:MAG TPA: hypothetical protein VI935_05795 [Thermodesulfobacteriota bacterium]|nr:hypothetical protein [Thermodesulfobacteriota bacterium]
MWKGMKHLFFLVSVVILLALPLTVKGQGIETGGSDGPFDLCINVDGVQEDYGSGSTELIQIDEEGNCALLEEVYPDIRERQDNPNFVEPGEEPKVSTCN